LVAIRNHKTLVGVFPVISPVGLPVKSALGCGMTEFVGRFILPFDASWGQMLLHEGAYTVFYGSVGAGLCYVEIIGNKRGSPKGIFLVREQNPASVVQNALVCTQRGRRHMICTLELPAIGKSIPFAGHEAGKHLKSRKSSEARRIRAIG
jgi:hypothetical protein